MKCSHGIDIDRPCPKCTDEALQRIDRQMHSEERNMSLELGTWLYLLLMVASVVIGIWFAMRD